MKHLTPFSIIAGMMLMLFPLLLHAQKQADNADVPRTISYQGLLTAPGGNTVPDGTYEITVGLYADALGQEQVWHDTYQAPVHNGVFNLYLGNGATPLPSSTEMNRPLWVGTSINGSEKMLPLTPLTASPYALNLPDHAITTGKLADGAVTAEKVDMDYVSGISVNGQKISGKGTVLDIRSSDDIGIEYDEVSKSLLIRSQPHSIAQKSDQDKTATVLDAMDANDNWIGRDVGFGGSNHPVIIGGTFNTIAGGADNFIDTLASYNFIGGGDSNIVFYTSTYNAIAGGAFNIIDSSTGYSLIGAGEDNFIDNNSDWSVIAGGRNNEIRQGAVQSNISGGEQNILEDHAQNSVISGGIQNYVDGHASVVGGGNRDSIFGDKSTIGGGNWNYINGDHSFIGGGDTNIVLNSYAAITGGSSNQIQSDHGFIGGGGDNQILNESSSYSTIAGGSNNAVGDATNATDYAAITGGSGNEVLSDYTFIGSGETNLIDENADWSLIAGGKSNSITSPIAGGADYSTVSGGFSNGTHAYNNTIGGGRENEIYSSAGTIAGGYQNVILGDNTDVPPIEAHESFIGGGSNNQIEEGAYQSTIVGGTGNRVQTDAVQGAIGGGSDNKIIAAPPTTAGGTTVASMATIPGGDNLTAQSWAQTVIGAYNEAKGSVPFRYNNGTDTDRDDPIFIVGNGRNNANRSNAFEVSYNGHSTVYDQNNTGATNSAIRGTTYTDNVIYAWADATPVPGPPGSVTVNCDFGVANIIYNSPGNYTVIMNLVDPSGASMNLSCGSVTATLTATDAGHFSCGIINTSPITASNTFNVFIRDLSCNPDDLPFTFKVTGRP